MPLPAWLQSSQFRPIPVDGDIASLRDVDHPPPWALGPPAAAPAAANPAYVVSRLARISRMPWEDPPEG